MPKLETQVLIIDDDEMNALTLLDRFKYEEMSAIHAKDGAEGLDFYKKFSPSLILLDQIMPGMSGIEVLHKIRHDIGDTGTPIVMLTALGQDDIMVNADKEGASGFIIKGKLSPQEVVEKVRTILSI
jgi:DNA-binding response OmpR family regulator